MPILSPAQFGRKATTRNARLRAALSGPTKSGKTYDSLVIATTLLETLKANNHPIKGNGEIILLDAEHGRAEESYADMFDFSTEEIIDYSPEAYIDMLNMAVNAGYSLVIIDQISHEWRGKGGALDEVQQLQMSPGSRYNSFTAFGVVSPKHEAFMNAISTCPIHIICTMRSKMDYVLNQNEKGSWVPQKVGMAPIQRNEAEYEFDVYGTITGPPKHVMTIETRGTLSRLLGDREFHPGKNVDDPGEIAEIGKLIGEWITGRTDVDQNGYATRDQINEIRKLGDSLPVDWKKILKAFKISGLSIMTPEIYEKMKETLNKNLAIKLEKQGKADL
jgi:hypothetical protein